MKTRQIALTDLQIGMFVTALDRSWLTSPFLRHKFLVHSPEQIERLKRAGVRQVTIDVERGADIPQPTSTNTVDPTPSSASASSQGSTAPSPSLPVPAALQGLQQELLSAHKAKDRLVQTISRFYAHLQENGTIDPKEAAEAVREITIVTRTLTDPAVFMAMSQGRETDPTLSTHAVVTCCLALIVGQAAKLDLGELHDLACGALLHDIGLMGLPRTLLDRVHNTSSVLPRSEMERYQTHPRVGAIRIEQQHRFPLAVRQIVAEHHALPNGRGFPAEVAHSTTGLLSRIVMIVDRYDDLLSGFGGARPLQPQDALQRLYLEAQEKALDPDLTSLFIKRVGIFPIYSVVLLNTGERAIVTEINEQALQLPVVQVTHTPTGQPLAAPARVDLTTQDPSQPTRSVAQVIGSTAQQTPPRRGHP